MDRPRSPRGMLPPQRHPQASDTIPTQRQRAAELAAVDGAIAARDCTVQYKRGGRVLAVASIYRDGDSLIAEAAMEQQAQQ